VANETATGFGNARCVLFPAFSHSRYSTTIESITIESPRYSRYHDYFTTAIFSAITPVMRIQL
jgi:hypothetical protein